MVAKGVEMMYINAIEAILIIFFINNVWVNIRNLVVRDGSIYPFVSGVIASAIFILEKIQ